MARLKAAYLALPPGGALLVALALFGGIALSVRAAVRPEPRALTLTARGMAFYLPGDPTPNPRLLAERSEELRITLRNEDGGMAHDLAVPGRDGSPEATAVLRRAGDSAALTLRVPARPGEYEYFCNLHARM